MKYTTKTLWMGLLAAPLLTSCATIFSGTRAEVVIDGNAPEPLTVVADRQQFDSVSLPTAVSIRRKHLNEPIQLTSEHYDYADIIPGQKTNPWVWANYFNGFIGVPIDLATGAIYEPALSRYLVRLRSKDEAAGKQPLSPVGVYKPEVLGARRNHSYHHEIDLLLGIGSSIGDGIHHRQYRAMERLGFGDDEFCGFTEYGGAVGLRYFYHLNPWLAVGGSAGFAHAYDAIFRYPGGYDRDNFDAETSRIVPSDAWCHVHTEAFYAMPAAKASWWNKGALTCYSLAALGVQYRHQWTSLYIPHYNPLPNWIFFMPYKRIDRTLLRNVHQWRLAPQLTVLGLDIGRRRLHGFLELGYGIEGVFNLGLSYRFHAIPTHTR